MKARKLTMKNKWDTFYSIHRDYEWCISERADYRRTQNRYNCWAKYRFKIEEVEVADDYFEPVSLFDKKTTKKLCWKINDIFNQLVEEDQKKRA